MNKFKGWIDDANIENANVYDLKTFNTDTQRTNGFQKNTLADSTMVNTILRQSNNISVAIMNALLPDDQTLDYQSSISHLSLGILKGLKSIPIDKATNADNAIKKQDNTYVGFKENIKEVLSANGDIIIKKRLIFDSFIKMDAEQAGSVKIAFKSPASIDNKFEFIIKLGNSDDFVNINAQFDISDRIIIHYQSTSVSGHSLASFDKSAIVTYDTQYDSVKNVYTISNINLFNFEQDFINLSTPTSGSNAQIHVTNKKNIGFKLYKIYEIIG